MHNPAGGSAYLRVPPPRSFHAVGTALSTASHDFSKSDPLTSFESLSVFAPRPHPPQAEALGAGLGVRSSPSALA
jgi:hypothetical protein